MRLTFEVSGQKLVNRELLRVGAYAGDAAPAFEAIAALMMTETREQFASEGGHASGGWAPLKPATVAAKQRGGFRPEILRRTDNLLHSLTIKGDPNQVLEITGQSLLFGSSLPYAEYHQTGTATMPMRRPLAFTQQARVGMTKILQRWILVGELAP